MSASEKHLSPDINRKGKGLSPHRKGELIESIFSTKRQLKLFIKKLDISVKKTVN